MGNDFSQDIHATLHDAIERDNRPVLEIADQSGMSADYLYKRLRNELPYTVTDIERICNTLHLDPYTLIQEARPADTPADTRRIAHQLRTIAQQVEHLDQTADKQTTETNPAKLNNEEREQLARERLKSKVTLAANIDPHMRDEINHGGERV